MIGLTPVYEGEEGDAFLAEGGGDRKNLSLPPAHIAYMKALRKGTKTPIIAVINAGSAVDVAAIAPYAGAVLLVWYPGEEGGDALADILFGKVSPSGHLPLTFYNSLDDLPAYNDYSMKGRTYRYFNGKVQYPFGFGMSYTSFSYKWKKQPVAIKDSISFEVSVKNTGDYNGAEVVQVYVHYPQQAGMPLKELKAFRRLSVNKNQEADIEFHIPVTELQKWDSSANQWKLFAGEYKIVVGSNSADEKLTDVYKVQ